ncbi:MAG: LptA/OstA family protein [Candidatus Binataceae bacterium]
MTRTASLRLSQQRVASPAKDRAPAGAVPFGEFSSNHGPISITSDRLSLDYKGNTAIFSGHARVVQAGGVLTCDKLIVKYAQDSHEVQEAVADGNVRMSQGTRWATSDHAVLNQTNHTVVLTGNPVVHDGNDQVTGKKITVELQTGNSIVDGAAKAVFFPRTAKSGDNQQSTSADQTRADPAQ